MAEIAGERTYLRCGIRIEPGATVLDVGANVGVAAVFFAEECGAGAVHSFEPIAPLHELLCENASELPAVVPHHLGLFRETCRMHMTYYPGSAAMSGLHADPDTDRARVERYLVSLGRTPDEAAAEVKGRFGAERVEAEFRRLSDVLRDQAIDEVDLLKIDVEGAELDVVAGVDEADWERISQVVGEVHSDENASEMFAALSARGFRVEIAQDAKRAGTPVRMLYARRA